jgi:DNA-binding transcriptional regulator of glucitol operon
MKTLSYILTCLLILPVVAMLLAAWQYVHFQSLLPGMQTNKLFVYEMLSPIIIEVIFAIIAIYLNIKNKYLENSVMCGTLLVSFILSILLRYGVSFLFLWLK